MSHLSLFATCLMLSACTFYQKQRDQDRVQEAYARKEAGLRQTLAVQGIDFDHLHLLLVAYKAEGILEVHLKHPDDQVFGPVLSYPVCAASGKPGPKHAQGDRQVPEGFYHIERFNPNSSFLLSLGINYPNPADLARTSATDPGGDIFIHGGCVSVGCLAMTDDKIREIYLLVLQARKSGQEQIPVYIFPFRMTDQPLQAALALNPEHRAFWQNLQQGYARFVSTRQALTVDVEQNGLYQYR